MHMCQQPLKSNSKNDRKVGRVENSEIGSDPDPCLPNAARKLCMLWASASTAGCRSTSAPRGDGNLVNASMSELIAARDVSHCALRILLFSCFNVGKGQGEDFSPSRSSQAGSTRWQRSQSVTVTTPPVHQLSLAQVQDPRWRWFSAQRALMQRHATLYPTVATIATLKRIPSESTGEEIDSLSTSLVGGFNPFEKY